MLTIELVYSHMELPLIFERWCNDRLFDGKCAQKFPRLSGITSGMPKKELTDLMAQKILNHDGLPKQELKAHVCACVQFKEGVFSKIEPHPLIDLSELSCSVVGLSQILKKLA